MNLSKEQEILLKKILLKKLSKKRIILKENTILMNTNFIKEENDRSQWIPITMRRDSELLALRERTTPFTRETSFVLSGSSKTEIPEYISGNVISNLIMEHLYSMGFTETLKTMEEETGLIFIKHYRNSLKPLINIGISKEVWTDLPISRDSDPIVEAVDDLSPFYDEDEDVEDTDIYPEEPDNDSNIRYLSGNIHLATVNKMIEKLTNQEATQKRFARIFLLTYKSFLSSGRLLYKLKQRFNVPEDYEGDPKIVRIRTVGFIKTWVETRWTDFNSRLLADLSKFVDDILMKEPKIGTTLKNSIEKMKRGGRRKGTFFGNPPEPNVPRNVFSPTLSVFDISPIEIARQLTLLDFKIFSKIEASELLRQAWSKAKLRHRSPNVLKLIDRFNTLSEWVTSLILKEERCKKRAKIIIFFIKILVNLRELNNYNTLNAVISGLDSSAIHRLKFTWEEVNNKNEFDELKLLISQKGSYKAYRESLQSSNGPTIPYLGVYLQDLTFIDDGSPDYIDNLVNFSKNALIFDIVEEIRRFQNNEYDLHPVDQIQTFISRFPRMDKSIFFPKSLEIEPRGVEKAEIRW